MNDGCLSKRANKGHVLGGGVEKEWNLQSVKKEKKVRWIMAVGTLNPFPSISPCVTFVDGVTNNFERWLKFTK